MFTKTEYAGYLHTISNQEQKMVRALERLMPGVSDVELVFTLEAILQEELAHNRLVGDIIDRVLMPPSHARMLSHMQILGEAHLSPAAGGAPLPGHTIGFSLSGLCVELAAPLSVGDRFRVAAQFYDPAAVMDRKAIVGWCSQIGPSQYRAGLTFEDA